MLLLFLVYYTSITNNDPFGKLLLLILPYGLTFVAWLPINNQILQVCLIISILLCMVVLLIIRKTNWVNGIVRKFDFSLSKYINQIGILFLIILYSISLFLFFTAFNTKINFNMWTYDYVFTYDISKINSEYVKNFNIAM